MSAIAARSTLVIVPAFDRLQSQPLRQGRAITFSMLDTPQSSAPQSQPHRAQPHREVVEEFGQPTTGLRSGGVHGGE